MKKIIAAFAASLIVGGAFAASGIFGAGVVIDNGGTTTLYELSLLGDGRHNPLGFSPVLDSNGWGTYASPTPNLGTFDPSSDTLVFKGGELLTWKNSGSDVTGANIYLKIDDGAYSSAYSLGFNEDNVSGNSGDQRWYTEGNSVDVLSGLANGTHQLTVYLDAPSTDGTHFANNGGGDFSAEFNVIPEPATMGFVVVMGVGMLFARRIFML